MGTTVQSVSQSDGIVHARLSDGTERHVDLLVGADGIRSQVRALCFKDEPPGYVGQMYWRTALHEPVVDRPTMMFDADRFVALLPLGGGLTYLAAQLHADVPITGVPANDTELLRESFADFRRPMTLALRALETAEPVHFGPAEEVVRDEWRSGRVILIGDAAHSCSPVLAQGGSLAMEDGVVLSHLLGELADIDRALTDFVGRREPRCRMVRERTELRIAMLNSGADEVDLAENMRATYAQLAEPI
jgi:2-polyprenyl-6-methoxyphenol hydroxylase-like FAD-dependent oxidoreductase